MNAERAVVVLQRTWYGLFRPIHFWRTVTLQTVAHCDGVVHWTMVKHWVEENIPDSE